MSLLTPDKLPLRDELKGQSAYGAPQLTVKNQLNTNENPYPPSQGLIEELGDVVVQRAQELNRYPDRDALGVRGALADYVSRQIGVDVSVENLWSANGSNEVLQQLLQAFGGPGRTAMGFTPSYSMHPLLAAGTFTEFIAIDRDPAADFSINMDSALDAIARYAPDVIFITTPNNPTGGSTSLEDIEKILKVAPGIVIIDEAYAEFSDAPSATTLLEAYPDKLVVSRTMSKAFDFAGGRLGYFVADPAFVQAVQLVRLPYHLSTLSQAAAEVALRHSDETLNTVARLVSERERVQAELERLGYSVVPSDSNFIFFGGIDDAPGLWQKFLDHDVLIRDVGVPGYLRVTIGTPEENDDFLTAAQELAPVR